MEAASEDAPAWRERALELGRERLLRAMAELSCERGFAGVTVAAVCAQADVSRACFYELFANREACFLAVLGEGYARVSTPVSAALQQAGDWLEGARLALAELLFFLRRRARARARVPPRVAGGGPVGARAPRTPCRVADRADREPAGVDGSARAPTLLGRLQKEGVMLKRPGSPGHPNARTLTPVGEEIARTLREHETGVRSGG